MAKRYTFRSRGENHRLVRVQRQMGENPATGRQFVVQEGLTYSFAPNGLLEVEAGQHVLPDGPNGQEQDALAWLRAHAQNGEYFTEDGNEPERPRPTEEEMNAAIIAAVSNLDSPSLEQLEANERQTHARPVVLQAISDAQDAVAGRRAELAAAAVAHVPPPASGLTEDGGSADPPPPPTPPGAVRHRAPGARRPARRTARRAASRRSRR